MKTADLVDAVRDISRQVEATGHQFIFPGWDRLGPRETAVRRAAHAIHGDENPDSCERVSAADVAALLHYVADIMEE